VDWFAPEQATGVAEYRQFAQENASSILASAVLHPTSTATVVRVTGAQGGDVVTADGPYAETKEALTGYYLIEAGTPYAANCSPARTAMSKAGPPESDRPATCD
jgi:hypothetical protein